MSLCIIGAGTAGLCCARRALEYQLCPTVFELSTDIGGTWVFNKNVGTVNGIDVHSSMYENLRTNLPKEIMGYPDFKIGENKYSYIKSEEIYEFLNHYAEHFDLKKYIQFNSYVIRVLQKNNMWQVMVKNVLTNKLQVQYFDHIFIANGHYNTPNYADIPNANLFKGNYLHSHDYRSSAIFADKTVLVIGGGPSALDLSNIISKSAKHVTLSHHVVGISNSIFLKNVATKPDVKELDEYGAHFVDGSYENFDTIFYCTGYKYAFPFLSVTTGIYVEDNYVQMLYKQCINIRNPTMAIIGLPFYVCAAQMMDLQARFVLSYFYGPNKLPSTQEMLEDTVGTMNKRWQAGYKKRQAHMLGENQMHYFTELANEAKIENIKPVMAKLHIESTNCFNENLLHFREDIFRLVDSETFLKLN
ncbi:senecionine N-oxygenase isoform X1 [Drosophila nasuta]|uniref:senecionine N-oxygenase isoform X1 n=2 Tax=Drosophila nasuta TaxID=42062 RepID=UPI00295EFB1C|nr:senecionine N-oxygenase isoform X1 [Drosophila nasuta]